ncbi:MAG: transposase, partial [Bacillota bacterium]
RMFYTYPDDNYRAHPPIPRNTELWDKYAGLRHIVEQVISRLKLPLQLGKLYTQNLKTAKADFFMAGVAHLICVLLAYNLKAFDKIRSPKSFVA